ncbi:hypothetical protein AQ616_18890 [Oceanobacillus sp. E9]|uniref:phage tail family protein n=1 Tax=Oceanobacillus sp. E9 TaxID=1742575 RepID=UPI00084E5EF2|nr:phage tail family protein [Oceanobacillus sp. E9]OEH52972.1 hypothetical protein AQ616_18890 [Oceanobacillus sp. E9]
MRNLINLWDKDGKKIDLSKYGLIGRRLIIPSPSYDSTEEKVTGRPGTILLGKQLNPRSLTAIFVVEAYDYADIILLRDELYKLFSEPFYVGEVKQPGKRWMVECIEEWEPERLNINTDSIEIPLISRKGVAESIGTTLTPLEWDVDMWQWGMGLQWGDYAYEQTENEFTIFNAGNVKVDPRYFPLKIIINAETSDYIEIVNHTTGDTYRYNGSLRPTDDLVIDGIRSTKNLASVFRDTNKRLLTLASGANKIEVRGATVERVIFDFKFYTL